jgi:hypothetical protein
MKRGGAIRLRRVHVRTLIYEGLYRGFVAASCRVCNIAATGSKTSERCAQNHDTNSG